LEEALGDAEAAAPAPVAERTLGARVREGALAALAKLEPVDGELWLAASEVQAREGELFVEGAPWRFAATAAPLAGGGGAASKRPRARMEVLAGDCERPESLVQACGERA